MAVNMGSAVAYLDLNTERFRSGLKSAQADLKVFESSTATATDKIKGVGSALTHVGSTLTVGVSMPLLAVGTASVKTASDFQRGMSTVQAISGATGNDMKKLEQKAIEMGSKTEYSAKQSAEAFKYMAQAGWKTKDMIDGISGIMNLATVGEMDLGRATTITTNTLSQFGLKAKDAGRLVDDLTAVSTNSNTSVSQMGDALENCGNTMGSMGYTIEDTALALGVLANKGLAGSEAGTALRNIFSSLAHPVGESKKAIEELGISLVDSNGNALSCKEVMQQLREKFSGLTQEQKVTYATMIAGREGMNGLLAITNTTDAEFNKLTGTLKNANGSADKYAQTVRNNLQGALKMLGSSIDTAGQSIGKILIPQLTKLVQGVTKVIDKFNNMSDGQKKVVVAIGEVVAILPIVTTLFGKALPSVTKFASGAGKVVKTLGKFAMAHPAIAIITTIATVLVTAYMKSEKFRKAVDKLIEGIKKGFSKVVNFVKKPIDTACKAFLKFEKGASKAVDNVVKFFTKDLPKGFKNGVKAVSDFVSNAVKFISELPSKIWTHLQNAIQKVIQWGSKIISEGGKAVTKFIETVVKFFTQLPEKIWNFCVKAVDKIIQWGSKTISEGQKAISKFLETVVKFITQLPSKMWTFLQQAIQKIIQWGTQTVTHARTHITNFLNTVVQIVTQLPSKLWNFLNQAIQKVIQWGTQTVTNGRTHITNFLNTVGQIISQLPSKIWTTFTQAIQKVVQWGTQTVTNGKTAITNFLNAVNTTISKLPSDIGKVFTKVVKSVTDLGSKLFSAGKSAFNRLLDGIMSVTSSIVSHVRSIASTVAGIVSDILSSISGAESKASSAKNSHANGLSYVPYDGYYAELHEGERVLTKTENEAYNKGRGRGNGSGDTFNFYNTKPTPYEYSRQMKRAKRELGLI